MSEKQGISRRTVLRGVGASLALPWIESLAPRAAAGEAAGGGPPRRMVFLFVPNGAHMPDWTPAEEGPLEKLPPILQPLDAFKGQLSVLSGLTIDGGRPHGDGPGDHARCVASFLTCAHPKKTDGKDIRAGTSVDQAAATQIGHRTRLASLELGCEPSAQAGRCDSGYSCIYTSNMSWRTPTSPMTKEVNPRAVFDRLFGDRSTGADREALTRRNRDRRSILDYVAADAEALKRRLGAADQQKLEEYLYAVRSIERRIEESEKLAGREVEVPDHPRPAGVPKQFDEHVRLMMDMMVLALSTDSTRIATFMFTNAGSNRSYPQIGVSEGHHTLSHHGNDPEKQAKIATINRHHVGLLAYFLEQLRGVEQQGGTLLDHSMVLYGSGIGDGNRHNHDNLPILLAGSGGGTLRPGRHVRYAKETPMANLYLAMLRRMGAEAEKFADSTGELEGLG
jgi:hypothetical protein